MHAPAALETRDLNAWFGDLHVVKGISLSVPQNDVYALIGPSGCGKSTFIRCLNRLHEETDGARVKGEVLIPGAAKADNIYASGVDPVSIRRRVGMVFQKPNPFPGLSIYDNVAVGLKLAGIVRRNILDDVVETSLRQAALWEEVKDKLKKPGTSLSGGQQQRLCIARALAVKPQVLLMDEPTSALDPISTARIEELVIKLRNDVTVLIVTHNMQQAARISNRTAFFLLGELVETGATKEIFTNPKDTRTEQYITGRFG
ncbi:MAG: phosphate ABC transporter ATP-binding protein PstB [Bdellovibrionales bacterium]|jgi:phosphate transport system ATP-binding protein|nr:phosphate ABC transporter ATP-binding protein PstB [Bdellovibrionales bacterium]